MLKADKPFSVVGSIRHNCLCSAIIWATYDCLGGFCIPSGCMSSPYPQWLARWCRPQLLSSVIPLSPSLFPSLFTLFCWFPSLSFPCLLPALSSPYSCFSCHNVLPGGSGPCWPFLLFILYISFYSAWLFWAGVVRTENITGTIESISGW